jgi:hypothetical protein
MAEAADPQIALIDMDDERTLPWAPGKCGTASHDGHDEDAQSNETMFRPFAPQDEAESQGLKPTPDAVAETAAAPKLGSAGKPQ